jgi:hypothetical protein
MYRFLFSFFLIFLISNTLQAQLVRGILKDVSDSTPISNATVKLISTDSTSKVFTSVSNNKGSFTFNDIPAGDYTLTASSIGYETLAKIITVEAGNSDLGTFAISKGAKTLQTVIVNGAPPPVKQKDDTLEYAANQFKVNPDANAEDLIKKMPGITVDQKGSVTAQGETVQKVTVDGRDFFGDDATATLRNLPSEVIDKIQVFDKLSDQAQLTGFDDGNTTKSINIVTKADMRTGSFGRVYAGYGTDDRYGAGGNVSFFNNNRRISLVGLFNNVNQQNFSSQDLLGVTSSRNRGGGGNRGGRGGGNFRGGGDGSNFLVGQQNGISKTNAFGINYSDLWGKKIDVTASYFFNNSNTGNNETVNQQNFITKDTTQYYDENTISNTNNYNNRANIRLNYKIDSANTILFTSSLNFQNNKSNNNVSGTQYLDKQTLLSQTANDIISNTSGYNLSNNLLFRHAFPKRGRSISFGINTNFSDRNGTNYLNADNSYYKGNFITMDSLQQLSDQQTNGNNYRFNLVYTEPVGKKAQLQLNYNPSFQTNHADQETFNYDYGIAKYSLLDTSLSNKFDNTYNTHNGGITYRLGDRNNMISAGVSYQYGELKSDQQFPVASQIDKSFSNILGNAFARLKLSSKSNLRIIYRGSVNPPSINQLQNVINNSNQFFYSTGNPDLKQQYTNNFITRYTYTNSVKGQSFFANIFLQTTKDYVANATYTASQDSVLTNTITLYKGSQISKPVNLNGYLSARSFFTFGMPLKFIKSNLNWNAGLSYMKLPGLINNVSNVSNTYNYSLGAVLSSNISEYVDFNLSYSANINVIKNTIRPDLNSNYFSQSAGIQANLLTKKGLFFQNDLSNQYYNGLSDGFNQNYWLWNIAVGQKFLKNQAGELKLSVFDLLKQNKSITRTTTASYIEDDKNQVLQQYFMLTFTYKLKNFGKASARSRETRDPMREPMMRQPMMR